MGQRTPRLKDFGFLLRVGLSVAVFAMLAGYGVAGYYLKQHYENRDEQPGLTLTDIEGAYKGAEVPPPMMGALEGGHPEGMPEADRQALIAWLTSETTERDYENFDLDPMPADVIFDNCLSCHARSPSDTDNAYTDMPLEYWDDIAPLMVTKRILPKDRKIVVASIHAHLPTMALVLIAMTGLAALTRWPGFLTGLVSIACGLGLIVDFAGQYYVRDAGFEWLLWGIVGGGTIYAAGVTVLGLAVIADCWLPGGRSGNQAKAGYTDDISQKPMQRPV